MRVSLPKTKQAEGCLLLVALIWGIDFVAQRQGVLQTSPLFFNAASFGIGALILGVRYAVSRDRRTSRTATLKAGILTGVVLFIAMALQSGGIATTSTGKTAFITSLYILFVPVISLALGTPVRRETWFGCLIAVAGLYLLCVKGPLVFAHGDLLVLGCALFWAIQILLIGHYSPQVDGAGFVFWQFATCSLASLGLSLAAESVDIRQARAAWLPILFNGLFSSGIAYPLQIYGQRWVTTSRASLFLSLETVFAALGGWLLLHEKMGGREILGGALMFAGILVARLAGDSATKEKLR
jgi:drug/metabolite transporter (DMT)-like permease